MKFRLQGQLMQAYLCFVLLLGVSSVIAGSSSDSVDYHKYEMDSPIRDILWCGKSNEAILILTLKGSLYRSRDRGSTWKQLINVFKKSAELVTDEG